MHFSDEQWLDFIRRAVPREEEQAMQAHLDGGCDACKEVYTLWQGAHEIITREPEYQPSEAVVDMVKRAYAARHGAGSGAAERARSQTACDLAAQFATLVFDSFLGASASAATRSLSPSARHLLYRAGSLAIDVRCDAYNGPSMMIAGQVMEDAGGPLADREVCVMRDDDMLARTATNTFGEFQMEVDDGQRLFIRLDLGERRIVLSLPD